MFEGEGEWFQYDSDEDKLQTRSGFTVKSADLNPRESQDYDREGTGQKGENTRLVGRVYFRIVGS